MEKLNLPDASVLVESLAKAKKGTKAKGISVFLAPGIDLPTGGGGYKNVDTLPSISEADDSMFYILPDGSLNYIKDNEWQTVSGGSGAIAGEGLPSPALSVSLGTTYIDTTTGKYYVANRVGATTSWTEVETMGSAENIGIVYAYSEVTPSIELEWGENCTLTNYDYDKYIAWCEANPTEWEEPSRNFDYDENLDAWVYYGEDQIVIPAEEMYATTGLELTLEDPEMGWANCSILTNVEVNKESEIIELPILNLLQFNTLSFPEAHAQATLGNDNTLVYSDAIKQVALDWNKITYFPDSFLSHCYNLETISSPDGSTGANVFDFRNIKAVGSNFMNYCASLVIPPQSAENGLYIVNIHSDCQIGENFLSSLVYEYYDEGEYKEESYTGKISIIGGGKAGDGFLSGNVGVTEIRCNSFTEFGDRAFLGNSAMTNLSISSVVTRIGSDFCGGCEQLAYFGTNASTMTFQQLEKLGSLFLQNAYAFNQKLEFPRLTTISGHFLAYCRSFNSPIFLPALQFVGEGFMLECASFAQPLALPNLISAGNFFLFNAKNFTGQLTVQNPSLTITNSEYILSVPSDQASSPMYQLGVTVYGAGRQAFLDLGNIDSGYYRRKLIDAGGGGGGSDTTYSFTDTANGWCVNGSDGSYFEHTDKGGGEPADTFDITIKYMEGNFTKTYTIESENCSVTFDDEENKGLVLCGYEGGWGWRACPTLTSYTFDPTLGNYGMNVTTTDPTKRACFRIRTQVAYDDTTEFTTNVVATDLNGLCDPTTCFNIPNHAITEIVIKTEALTYGDLPENFCRNMVNLRTFRIQRPDGSDIRNTGRLTFNSVGSGYFSNTPIGANEGYDFPYDGLEGVSVKEYGSACFTGGGLVGDMPGFYTLNSTEKVGDWFGAFTPEIPFAENIVLETAGNSAFVATKTRYSDLVFSRLYALGVDGFAYIDAQYSGISLPVLVNCNDGLCIGAISDSYLLNAPSLTRFPIDMCNKAIFSPNENSPSVIKFNPYAMAQAHVPQCFKNCSGYFGVKIDADYGYDSSAFATEDNTAPMYVSGVKWYGTGTPPSNSDVSPYRKIVNA